MTRRQKAIADTIRVLHSLGVNPPLSTIGHRIGRSKQTVQRELTAMATGPAPVVVSVTAPGGSGAARIVLCDCTCPACVTARASRGE